MSTVNILKSVPRSQAASPFFNRLPFDLRLMIYLLMFRGSTVSGWFDSEFTKTKLGSYPWHHLFYREGQCCFHHRGGGFSLLVTCRKLYMEAFPTYWSSIILFVLRSYSKRFEGCELQQVCAYLPAPIKENLRHMRNIRLPVIGYARPPCDASNWAPTLLRDFPKLKTCSLPHTGLRRLAAAAGGLETTDLFRVTGGRQVEVYYSDVGPFQVKTGESPAAFLERMTGIQRSSGVIILALSKDDLPYDDRTQLDGTLASKYFNWATGLVFQTNAHFGNDEIRWDEVMSAKEGSDWSRCSMKIDGHW